MPEKFEDKRVKKAEATVIVHYDPALHDRDSIRKWLENQSSSVALLIVANIRPYK